MNIILVFILGAMGGIARFAVGEGMVATLAVNLIGAFCLGGLNGFVEFHAVRPWIHDGLSAGFLGSFTTFSSFAEDAVHLMGNHPWLSGIYILGTIVGGISLAYLGRRISGSLYTSASRSIQRRRALHQTKTQRTL
ncbi:fluoride efflux transporter FluC [Alicyclobacillus acidiphilus]|uniref:fluoride efflux transporter FluC n=1 Tax=Alicyclobacillus acidiphilus TaxID=182455 RepID=UPI0009F8452E